MSFEQCKCRTPTARYVTVFVRLQGWKEQGLKTFFIGFLRVFKGFKKVFWYEDRTRKYDPKAHEKHPIHDTPYIGPILYLTKEKYPVSEGEEHHVKMKMKLMYLANHN